MNVVWKPPALLVPVMVLPSALTLPVRVCGLITKRGLTDTTCLLMCRTTLPWELTAPLKLRMFSLPLEISVKVPEILPVLLSRATTIVMSAVVPAPIVPVNGFPVSVGMAAENRHRDSSVWTHAGAEWRLPTIWRTRC